MVEAIVKCYDANSKGFILFDGVNMYYISEEKAKSSNIKVGDKVIIREKEALEIGGKTMQLVSKINKR